MAKVNLATIKNWFRTGLKPTQAQFWDTWDSFFHKDEKIPIDSIENITQILLDKADAEALTAHNIAADAHSALFETKVDKIEGKGLSTEDFSTEYRAQLETLAGSSIAQHYADATAMIADQVNQKVNNIYTADAAGGDATVVTGVADYEYLGTVLGTLADYRKLSEQESMDLGNVEKKENKVITISETSTDEQYPSAKLLYTKLAAKVSTVKGSIVDNTDPLNPMINFSLAVPEKLKPWNIYPVLEGSAYYDMVFANGLFVAAGFNGSKVATSPDGINWTRRTSPSGEHYYGIAYGNGTFVICGIEGIFSYSNDGINWINRPVIVASFTSVAYGNGLFVAVTQLPIAGGNVLTSPDGINWTRRNSGEGEAINWRRTIYANGLFVSVGASGIGKRVMTSPDGINWTLRNTPSDIQWEGIAYGNGLFVAVASAVSPANVMTSPDGINWTLRNSNGITDYFSGITYGNGIFVTIGNHSIQTSINGIEWITVLNYNTYQVRGISYGNDRFVGLLADYLTKSFVSLSPLALNHENLLNKGTLTHLQLEAALTALKTVAIPNITLLQANWVLVAGFYEYNYANVLILADTVVEVIPYDSTIQTVKDSEILPMVISGVGTLKIKAKNFPTANILIALNINK